METDEYELLEELNSTFYNLLPEARPLHNTSITSPKSVFVFTSEAAPKQDCLSEIEEELEEVEEGRNESKHEIGNSLSELFQFPVYKSYDNLELSDNNERFATCSFELSTSLQIQPAKCVNGKNHETKLKFCSQFESGNLAVASVNPYSFNEYFLALQRDTNSKATCQWFYFYIENKKNTGNYVFSIVNMVKNYSAYENGMRPCIFSSKGQLGWKRGGFDISYRKNSISNRGDRKYYTFQFSYNFEFENDRVYFAHSYPYTFTHLQQYLHSIHTLPGSLAQVKTLSRTPLNNPVNIVSITNPINSSDLKNKERKELILITARVHPGETNSSYVCESLINYLISNEESAINLRNNYIIKIIPFLNPDGVINGNYRTSCTGQDLNRRWNAPDQFLHPEIFSIKKYLTEINLKKALYIDLHGHSKKKSSFMYGCLNKENPYIPKEFPFILSKISSNFSYSNCNFSTPASREGTSRINVWKEFGVDYSYTMEISFCGPSRSKSHFLISDYFKIGLNLGQGISLYFCRKNRREEKGITFSKQKCENYDKGIKILEPVAEEMEAMFNEFYSRTQLMDQGLSESEGSESGEEEQVEVQIQTETIEKKETKVQISIEQKSTKEIKGLINKNMNDTKIRWTRRNFTRDLTLKNEQEEKINEEPTIKKRKSFILSEMNIRKVDLSEQLKNHKNSLSKTQNQIYLDQIGEKSEMKINVKMENEKIRGLSLKTPKEMNKIQVERKTSYVPYSLSKAKSHQISADLALMLPKVSQQDIRRQNKGKHQEKSDYNFDLSMCYEPPRSRLNSRLTSYSNRSPLHSHYQFETHKNLRYEPQKK